MKPRRDVADYRYLHFLFILLDLIDIFLFKKIQLYIISSHWTKYLETWRFCKLTDLVSTRVWAYINRFRIHIGRTVYFDIKSSI